MMNRTGRPSSEHTMKTVEKKKAALDELAQRFVEDTFGGELSEEQLNAFRRAVAALRAQYDDGDTGGVFRP